MRALAVLVTLVGGVALAHDVKGTLVYLDFGDARLAAEVQLPIPELTLALGVQRTDADSQFMLDAAALERYLRQHFSARARDGRPFDLIFERVTTQTIDATQLVVAQVSLEPPSGESARWLRLHSDLIAHAVTNHNTSVFVRHDLQNGQLDQAPRLLEMMHVQNTDIVIDRTEGTKWVAFKSVFELGMRHIADGTDHLLFLFVLLLPAPLLARDRRWSVAREPKDVLRALLWVVTAFTLGHSLTLIIGATGAVSVPSRAVESMIAVSIFVSALHALRPMFAGKEPWVAGSFGLVHGLAFASALTGLAVDRSTLVIGVLGFNLGIEAMQLVIVAMVLPALVVLSRRQPYRWLRVGGAVLAMGASLVWFAQRAFDLRLG